jgi:hypothetical protein
MCKEEVFKRMSGKKGKRRKEQGPRIFSISWDPLSTKVHLSGAEKGREEGGIWAQSSSVHLSLFAHICNLLGIASSATFKIDKNAVTSSHLQCYSLLCATFSSGLDDFSAS